MTKDEALKMALEALEKSHTCPLLPDDCAEAITAIKEALAQPEQEPDEVDIRSRLYQRIHELETQLAQPEQEPVAWIYSQGAAKVVSMNYVAGVRASPLYTTPPQRKPLTDEEIILIVAECAASHQHTDIHFARAIERAHGIKELV